MKTNQDNRLIVRQLQREVLGIQGLSSSPAAITGDTDPLGLGVVNEGFPGKRFPTGAVHEFISQAEESAAATNGFITALMGKLMSQAGPCIWVSMHRTLFPAALHAFGVAAERVIFIDTLNTKETLWAMEEALKCKGLAAVVGELRELGFTESRRLQLAVEASRVTGFVHRFRPRNENTVASVAKWKISPLSSLPEQELPGLGFPRWKVELLKIRNGQPGCWELEWSKGCFDESRVKQPNPGVPVRKQAG